ncbi:DUF1415 domain-containing protein [Aliikangiella sp. IMCC44632]
MNHSAMINSVKYWITETIIKHNFCPFAKRELVNQSIHFEVIDEQSTAEQLHSLFNEFKRLDQCDEIETSLLIYPKGLESFFDYLDFLELANQLLVEQNYEGIYQIASFHPDYCFADAKQDDPENFTNRSPLPILHILREASLAKAINSYPNPEDIPNKNIQVANQLGKAHFINILSQAMLISKQ